MNIFKRLFQYGKTSDIPEVSIKNKVIIDIDTKKLLIDIDGKRYTFVEENEINKIKSQIEDLKKYRLSFTDIYLGDTITIGPSGWYEIPSTIFPSNSKNYLFATISYYEYTSEKEAFSIHGKNKSFWINGNANSEIYKVTARFFYYMPIVVEEG